MKNYISLSLDNFQEMPRVLVTDTERSKWNIEDHGFEYDNEFHFYKVGDKIFNVSLSLVEFLKDLLIFQNLHSKLIALRYHIPLLINYLLVLVSNTLR